jgi:low molecular weight protein-tyrosine phosphatase
MRHLLADAGLEGEVEVQSAGTGDWHIGKSPDARATSAARGRGITLEGRARQVTRADFDDFDLVIAMDQENASDLLMLARPDQRSKIRLLRQFDAQSVEGGELDVPDPYYGGDDGFEDVLDIVDRACRGLLAELDRRGVR